VNRFVLISKPVLAGYTSFDNQEEALEEAKSRVTSQDRAWIIFEAKMEVEPVPPTYNPPKVTRL